MTVSAKMRNSPHSILPFLLQHVPVPEVPEPVSGDGPPGGPAGHLGARGHRGGASQGRGSDPRDGGGRGLDAMGPWGHGAIGGWEDGGIVQRILHHFFGDLTWFDFSIWKLLMIWFLGIWFWGAVTRQGWWSYPCYMGSQLCRSRIRIVWGFEDGAIILCWWEHLLVFWCEFGDDVWMIAMV